MWGFLDWLRIRGLLMKKSASQSKLFSSQLISCMTENEETGPIKWTEKRRGNRI
jgi:hypothetical protein